MGMKLNDATNDLLDGPHTAVLATANHDGRPQSSIIFVKRDGDTVVFSTIKGRLKTRNMARDPRVSLLVLASTGRYVEICGRGGRTPPLRAVRRRGSGCIGLRPMSALMP